MLWKGNEHRAGIPSRPHFRVSGHQPPSPSRARPDPPQGSGPTCSRPLGAGRSLWEASTYAALAAQLGLYLLLGLCSDPSAHSRLPFPDRRQPTDSGHPRPPSPDRTRPYPGLHGHRAATASTGGQASTKRVPPRWLESRDQAARTQRQSERPERGQAANACPHVGEVNQGARPTPGARSPAPALLLPQQAP